MEKMVISVVDDEMNRNISDKELQPKKMQNVKYLPVGDESWRAVKVISRAGKGLENTRIGLM